MECRLSFQDREITAANPKPAREKSEEPFFARSCVLLRLGCKGEDVSAFSTNVLLRKAPPEITIPQVIFPDGEAIHATAPYPEAGAASANASAASAVDEGRLCGLFMSKSLPHDRRDASRRRTRVSDLVT